MTDGVTPSWGLVTTVKAPLRTTLEFLAYHLDLGASQILLFLDNADPDTLRALEDHPKVLAIACDDTYWATTRGSRPGKHQLRQTFNATYAYTELAQVDWLGSIDVDEFLWPFHTVGAALKSVPPNCKSARLRPAEALANDDVQDAQPGQIWFKTWMPTDGRRLERTADIYPTYGSFIRGGFLSHVAGKFFLRCGLSNVDIKIHNWFLEGQQNPDEHVLSDMDLCHIHAANWQAWMKTYRYRLNRGSYREELGSVLPEKDGGLNLHSLFNQIEAEQGEAGLRAFFDEVCRATPRLRSKLEKHGLLSARRLELEQRLARHFPDFVD